MNNYTNEQKEKMQVEGLNKMVDELDQDKLPTANIMVAGITGTGKSTLLNAVFSSDLAETGKGRPVTEHIDEYQSPNIPIHIWDTVGLELDSEKTKESINEIKRTIEKKASSEDRFDRVHAIWYCINSGSSRYQGAELDFIRELHNVGVPFIIVLTQCIGDVDEINAFESQIKKINESMGMKDICVVQVCAKDFKVRGFTIEAFGLDDLVDTTLKMLPSFIKSGFVAAQKISKIQKRCECEKIVYSYLRLAKEGFWDRVPFANIICANSKIMNMFKKIGFMYNAQISQGGIQKIIDTTSINFENIFQGLLNPLNAKYYHRVMSFLELKRKEGFEVNIGEIKKSDRVPLLVVFYGYTFVSAIEILWAESTEEQLKDMDKVCEELIEKINKIIRERFK